MRINLYAQNRHAVIIDGIPITGFADGDFIEVDLEGNAAEITPGADGPAMNISTAQGGTISISLQPVSPQIGELYALRDAQQKAPRLFTIVVMSGVEEIIRANGVAFAKLSSFSTGGPTQQARRFDFAALEINMDTSGLEAIAGGFVGGLI